MRLLIHSPRVRRVSVVVLVLGLAIVAGGIALVQHADAATTTLKTFTTPGTYTWTVPTGVTNVTFDVYGASGGGVLQRNANHTITTISTGGLGGEAKGKFTVHAGEVFEIVVGGQGGIGYVGQSFGLNGSNGGGIGAYGGGGGGGSDVRIGGRGNPCITAVSCGYGDRIIVGGGGGGGNENLTAPTNGLSGGGLTGAGPTCPTDSGLSATQECGGNSGGGNLGGFGTGGNGYQSTQGGGGGGWYGGAGGDPGGGGSGYISPFAKSGSFPGGTRQGDGKVIITTTT